jgi:ATP-binding cassette subfamily A (ABC1) protein 12
MLTICLYIGYAVTIASAIRFQAWEKESQNTDLTQVMGMRHSVIWIVWLLISAVNMVVISCVLTVILKWGGLLPNTNVELIFMLMLTYSFSVLAFW